MPINLREPKRNVREPKRNVREPKRNVRDVQRNVRDVQRNVRDVKRRNVRDVNCGVVTGGFTAAEPEADLLALDEVIGFEDAGAGEHQACLPDPYPTATTRILCEL